MPHPLKPSLSLHRPKPLGARNHPPRLGSVDPHRCGALESPWPPNEHRRWEPPCEGGPTDWVGAGRGRVGLRGSGEAQGMSDGVFLQFRLFERLLRG